MSDKKLSDEIDHLKRNIEEMLAKIAKIMTDPISKPEIHLRYLKERVKYLKWVLEKYDLQFEGIPKRVFKRDIFYCELGFNLGSEQKEKRPVIILQNDRGNASSTTTIIAPISTHRDSEIYEDGGQKYIKYTDENGREQTKRLDYYEIPVEVDPGYTQEVKGYINLAQIRTISMKRLSKQSVAKVTPQTIDKIYPALRRLLS